MNYMNERDGGDRGGRGGGGDTYKPSTPASTAVTDASIASNVKADNLQNDPEAKPYDPNVAWDPEHWAGSGLPTATPPTTEPVRKPIGVPKSPIKLWGGEPIRRAPHYGQSFTARTSPSASAGTESFGGSEMMNPERFTEL